MWHVQSAEFSKLEQFTWGQISVTHLLTHVIVIASYGIFNENVIGTQMLLM